jgi:hypothetical protein
MSSKSEDKIKKGPKVMLYTKTNDKFGKIMTAHVIIKETQ